MPTSWHPWMANYKTNGAACYKQEPKVIVMHIDYIQCHHDSTLKQWWSFSVITLLPVSISKQAS
jgi:hypothetical protein